MACRCLDRSSVHTVLCILLSDNNNDDDAIIIIIIIYGTEPPPFSPPPLVPLRWFGLGRWALNSRKRVIKKVFCVPGRQSTITIRVSCVPGRETTKVCRALQGAKPL